MQEAFHWPLHTSSLDSDCVISLFCFYRVALSLYMSRLIALENLEPTSPYLDQRMFGPNDDILSDNSFLIKVNEHHFPPDLLLLTFLTSLNNICVLLRAILTVEENVRCQIFQCF